MKSTKPKIVNCCRCNKLTVDSWGGECFECQEYDSEFAQDYEHEDWLEEQEERQFVETLIVPSPIVDKTQLVGWGER